ncbi:hypothetical protein GCM10027059_22620 [Myceligenerans halotolerans]
MFVVGGLGYIGSALMPLAPEAVAVSRDGGGASRSWADLLSRLPASEAPVIVWLLDGAKHEELDRLGDLVGVLPVGSHVVYVSTCTVYGDAAGRTCTEDTPLQLVTPHAQLKKAGEDTLERAEGITSSVLRFGALYGADPRGIRRDRVTKWLTEAHDEGTVTVPDPAHWRGWLHRDQAARALHAAARSRQPGVFNVASANAAFADAVSTAARLFDAEIVASDRPDLLDYRIDATLAREAGLLTEQPGEDVSGSTRVVSARLWPDMAREGSTDA